MAPRKHNRAIWCVATTVLLLLKFILHYTASYSASWFRAYVTKGAVGNESRAKELWSSPLLMPKDEISTKRVDPNVP